MNRQEQIEDSEKKMELYPPGDFSTNTIRLHPSQISKLKQYNSQSHARAMDLLIKDARKYHEIWHAYLTGKIRIIPTNPDEDLHFTDWTILKKDSDL